MPILAPIVGVLASIGGRSAVAGGSVVESAALSTRPAIQGVVDVPVRWPVMMAFG